LIFTLFTCSVALPIVPDKAYLHILRRFVLSCENKLVKNPPQMSKKNPNVEKTYLAVKRSNAPQTDRMSLRGDHRSRMTLFCAPGPQEFPAFLSTILVHGAFLSTILSARHFPVPFPFVEYFSVPLNCTICANCTFVKKCAC